MKTTDRTDTVSITTKGQMVIPAWLREVYQIQPGTKALVQETPHGILIKPLTKVLIRRARGVIKKKPGEKPFADWWAEYKREEIEMEERKFARHRS